MLFKAKALQEEKEIVSSGTTQILMSEESRKTKVNQLELDINTNGEGLKIYTDAAWKCKSSLSNANSLLKEKAGLGIYFDWEKGEHKAIYIQAASFANSALQAESQAPKIAAQIGRSLQVQEPKFLTDNLILVQVLQGKDPTKYPGHWIIRPNLQQFLHHTQGTQASIFKIKRDVNKIAHDQAQQAVKIQNSEKCTYSCTKHPSTQFSVIAAISNLNVHPSTLLSVICL